MGARYEVTDVTADGDRTRVFHVLRADLVSRPGQAPSAASRYYRVYQDAAGLHVKREGRGAVRRLVKFQPHHARPWCSCGYTHWCPHRAIWYAMGLPEGDPGPQTTDYRPEVGRVDR